MQDIAKEIVAAFESGERVPRERVVVWCRDAEDIGTLALLYRVTGDLWDKIDPPLGKEETCRLIRRYFLECIRLNPQDGESHNRYEAAWEFESWFDHLANTVDEDMTDTLRESTAAITQLYLDGDPEVQAAIETGFLEHVLEQERLRHLFAHWADDERLSGPWRAALAWGEAHPNFTRGLRQEIGSVDDDDE